MRIDIVTLFPEMFSAVTDYGVSSQAHRARIFSINFWNPRDYTTDRHRTVDDRPYGGGPGMVMMAEPLTMAIEAAKCAQGCEQKAIYLSPQGRTLTHTGVMELSARSGLILVAGRYEGVDERVLQDSIDEEWSIGDYVIAGGELAAMVVIDAVIRQLPGALGNKESAQDDSYVHGLLDCGQYTRPEEFRGRRVPQVLLSGNHGAIKRWRMQQSLGATWLKRPDLLEQISLTDEQMSLLAEFQRDYRKQEIS